MLVSHRWVAYNWVRRREAEEADGSGPHGIRRNVESQLLMQSCQFPKRVRGCVYLCIGFKEQIAFYTSDRGCASHSGIGNPPTGADRDG